jgi:predicted RNA-binding Zn ribbon-like protein
MNRNHPPSGPPEDRDGFRFRGGNVAIDLAATLQARLKSTPRELLVIPADLDRWLVSAGLVAVSPGATAEDLHIAHALREAIYLLAGSLERPSLDREALRVLNEVAALPSARPTLCDDRRVELQGSVAGLLTSIAREAVHLFGGADAARIHQCQAPSCTLFFLDTSRSGDRRWCSMSACGNKAKVADFRRRKRAQESKA